MKIIDLLNKIANGEEVPEKIRINNVIYKYCGDDYLFKDKNNDNHEYWLFSDGYTDKFTWLDSFLKTEVEIIEEDNKVTQKHKIKGLGYEILSDSDNWCRLTGEDYSITDYEINPYILYTINRNNRRIQKKFDEILDYLEEIK